MEGYLGNGFLQVHDDCHVVLAMETSKQGLEIHEKNSMDLTGNDGSFWNLILFEVPMLPIRICRLWCDIVTMFSEA